MGAKVRRASPQKDSVNRDMSEDLRSLMVERDRIGCRAMGSVILRPQWTGIRMGPKVLF